jgi:hypothetical protein
LDFADVEVVDPDLATNVLDHVAMYVRQCPQDRLEKIQADLERLRTHARDAAWPEEMAEFVGEFLDNCASGEDEE